MGVTKIRTGPSTFVEIPSGPQGPSGAPGAAGTQQGPQGVQGPQGPAGARPPGYYWVGVMQAGQAPSGVGSLIWWSVVRAWGFQQVSNHGIQCDVPGAYGVWINLCSPSSSAFAIIDMRHFRPGVGDIESKQFVGDGSPGLWTQMTAEWCFDLSANDQVYAWVTPGSTMDFDARSALVIASLGG